MARMHPPIDMRMVSVFLQAARDRNFTLAGAKLGMTPSAVSKSISRLEDLLGTTLMERDSRSVTLTDAGLEFLARGDDLIQALDAAITAIKQPMGEPQGRLRVTVPGYFGRKILTPHLSSFLSRYPLLDLDIIFTNRKIDLKDDQVDVAIYLEDVRRQPNLDITECTSMPYKVCASPAYIARYGQPETPDDLLGHRGLGVILEASGRTLPWRFLYQGRWIEHVPRAHVLSNDVDTLIELALDGQGLIYVAENTLFAYLESGRLIGLMPHVETERLTVWAVNRKNASSRKNVECFVQFIRSAIDLSDYSERRRLDTSPAPSPGAP